MKKHVPSALRGGAPEPCLTYWRPSFHLPPSLAFPEATHAPAREGARLAFGLRTARAPCTPGLGSRSCSSVFCRSGFGRVTSLLQL